MDLTVLKQISYGLYIICANDTIKPTGCIINSLMQITSQNPIIAISLNKENYTYEVIKRTSIFSISILAQSTDSKMISRFGFYSGKDVDKFSGIEFEMFDGVPIISNNCSGYLICSVLQIEDMETHAVIFARLLNTREGMNKNPMTYLYYQQVIKGKTAKNAPTYFEEEKISDQWVCEVCGYQHNRNINLEDDLFRCPVCGATKEKFYLKQ